MEDLFTEMVRDHGLPECYSVNSIKRIKYCESGIYSRRRITIYEYIQEEHRQRENIAVLFDCRFTECEPVDFLDLPRLKVKMVNATQEYMQRFSDYLNKSEDARKRLTWTEYPVYVNQDIIITSTISPEFIEKCSLNVVIITNDDIGLKSCMDSSFFSHTGISLRRLEGKLFVLEGAGIRARKKYGYTFDEPFWGEK
jgi:hypothetical protein